MSTHPHITPTLRQDFAPLFVGHEQRLSPMHALLNLYPVAEETTALFHKVRETLQTLPHSQEKVRDLLQDTNWREHLVAVGCIFVGIQDAETLQAAWTCFDQDSWITPQLAAVLSLVDQGFASKARDRLLHSTMILGVGARQIGPIGEAEEASPTAHFRIGSKGVAALFKLYQTHPQADPHLLARLEQTEFPHFLMEEQLIDNGGLLAQNWVQRAKATL
ncbi:MAG: hypothetical protein H6728_12420 [Myxococcales bacterium]|nr:hypothetical protein [Myxococcales bacterium]